MEAPPEGGLEIGGRGFRLLVLALALDSRGYNKQIDNIDQLSALS